MDLNEGLEKFKQPDVSEAIDFLNSVKDRMQGYAPHIAIVPAERLEANEEELETEQLIQKWRKIQNETRFCNFQLHIPNMGDGIVWKMQGKASNKEHSIKVTFYSKTLNPLLKHTIAFIEQNRRRISGSTSYSYELRIERIGIVEEELDN